MNRVDRLLAMILFLQSRRVVKAEEMARYFGTSVRTVYRDIAALGEIGVPILAEAGVGYALMKGILHSSCDARTQAQGTYPVRRELERSG